MDEMRGEALARRQSEPCTNFSSSEKLLETRVFVKAGRDSTDQHRSLLLQIGGTVRLRLLDKNSSGVSGLLRECAGLYPYLLLVSMKKDPKF
jgi:hypothetical protein